MLGALAALANSNSAHIVLGIAILGHNPPHTTGGTE